jgi:tellurite resistance protein
MNETARLKNFPVSWFAIIMGMAGLTIAWNKAEAELKVPWIISCYLLLITVTLFIIISLLYLVKIFRYRQQVVDELHHPVKLNFFPAFSIALILLSIAFMHMNFTVSRYLWLSGTIIHFLFTLYVLSVWIRHTRFEIHHINPAWFIPVVGNILVPIAGVRHISPEVSWFFFSIGLLFWIILFAIIFYRVIFHQPLPGKLMPTLFILIAPPAVGFISYFNLVGSIDSFARVLYYSALFLTLFLFTQIQQFTKLQFYLSWWAYSFPMAAITIATILMYSQTGLAFFYLLSYLLLALLTLIIVILITRTWLAIARKQVCVEEK